MRTNIRYPMMLAAAVIAVLGLAACGGGTDHSGMPGTGQTAATPSSGAAFNADDVAFAQMMIPHHAQAVEMADLAVTRATEPELRQLAAGIKAAQQPEIDTMTGWLTAWGQPTARPGGHNMPGMAGMPGMMSDEDMGKLKAATGVDFDRMFARMTIAHHNGAIQMCRDVTGKGRHPQVTHMAAAIEQAQTAEVAQLQKILDRL